MSFTLLPVTDENFINRELLIKEMLDTLRDKSLKFGYALYGKRRVGKTSIFKELERILKKDKKIVPVYISVWDISTNSVNGFCDCLNEKTIDCFAPHLKLKHKAKDLALIPFNFARDILNNLKISISVKDLISFTIAKQPADKSPDRSLEDVSGLLSAGCLAMVKLIKSFTEILIFKLLRISLAKLKGINARSFALCLS